MLAFLLFIVRAYYDAKGVHNGYTWINNIEYRYLRVLFYRFYLYRVTTANRKNWAKLGTTFTLKNSCIPVYFGFLVFGFYYRPYVPSVLPSVRLSFGFYSALCFAHSCALLLCFIRKYIEFMYCFLFVWLNNIYSFKPLRCSISMLARSNWEIRVVFCSVVHDDDIHAN